MLCVKYSKFQIFYKKSYQNCELQNAITSERGWVLTFHKKSLFSLMEIFQISSTWFFWPWPRYRLNVIDSLSLNKACITTSPKEASLASHRWVFLCLFIFHDSEISLTQTFLIRFHTSVSTFVYVLSSRFWLGKIYLRMLFRKNDTCTVSLCYENVCVCSTYSVK